MASFMRNAEKKLALKRGMEEIIINGHLSNSAYFGAIHEYFRPMVQDGSGDTAQKYGLKYATDW